MSMSRRRVLTRPARAAAATVATLALVLGLAGMPGLPVPAASGAAADPKVLVFSKTTGFRHGSIPDGIAAIRQLGSEHGFAVDASEDATAFTESNLAQYDAVVWLSTTGNVLDAAQQDAFEAYVQGGGGYVGVHAAADTEYDWSWYGDLVGAYFNSHPAQQDATVRVVDPEHPSTAHLPAAWSRFDEWYNYRASPARKTHVLAELDESSYDPGAGAMGDDHPIAWCQDFDGGRSWYTGMGHTNDSYSEEEFLDHVLGGIEYAAGVVEADCAPPSPPDEECVSTASDEFEGDALDTSIWSEIVRENSDAHEVSGCALRITTEEGDLWMGGGDVKNIISQAAPAGDFTVTTEVTIDADGGAEQAGLMLYAGDDDYVKLNHIGRDGNRWSEFIVERGGEPRFDGELDRSPNVPADFPTTFQLRITRDGGAITGAYSTDEGATWTTVGRPVTTTAPADPRIAVFAQTNDASQVTEAAFDWVRVTGAGAAGGPDDEFEGDALDCGRWSRIVRENPERLAVSDGALRITTANGDLWGSGGNAENIVLQPAPGGAWTATTELTMDASGGGEQGGLMLYSGDDEYAKLGHIAKDGEKSFEFVVEEGGAGRVSGSTDGVPVGDAATFQLRLTYADGMLSAAYSPDGMEWTEIGEVEDVSGLADPHIGLFAQTGDDSEVTEAAFDWFHLDVDDSTGPTVRAEVDGLLTSDGEYLGSADVTLTASDGATIEYALDGGAWQPYTEPVRVTGAGEHEVAFRATDDAGDTSDEETEIVTIAGEGDCEPVAPEEGFTAIYDGTLGSLADWSMAGPGGFDPGAEDCTIDAWGGMGLLWYSAHELTGPYTIRTEWKIYSDDDNSGVFIGFPDPQGDPWNPVNQGYEIQIDPTDDAIRTTGAVYSFQAPDEEARAEAINGYGEWNVMEVEVDGNDITIRLNGTVINEYTSPHPERSVDLGYVGIQNDGAGRDVTYRSVQVKGGGLTVPDTTAPETAAALDPADPGTGGTYDGPVGVTLSATDGAAGSGVGSTEYRIDGGEWVQSENAEGASPFETAFTVEAEGDHVVEFRSTDGAGNEEETDSVEFLIAAEGPGCIANARPATGVQQEWTQFGDSAEAGEWAGGDGNYSVALPDDRIAWLFNDTFLGPVGEGSSITPHAPVHNTIVTARGDSGPLETIMNGTAEDPLPLVGPPGTEEPWYWNGDGIVDDGKLYVIEFKQQAAGEGHFGFEWIGTDLAAFSLPDFELESVEPTYSANGVQWGVELLRDGDHIYIYGVGSGGIGKDAYVARAPVGELDGEWEFYSGDGWSPEEDDAAPILGDVGSSYSVSRVQGRYVLATTDSFLGSGIYVHNSPTPSGFAGTERVQIYDTPEGQPEFDENAAGDIYTYNIAAHEHLGDSDTLVLSYNVNSTSISDLFDDINNNRARFIEVTFGECPDDETPPETAAALDPEAPGAGGTYNGPVGVTLSAADDAEGSGVEYTEYRLTTDGTAGEWVQSDNEGDDDPFETSLTVSEEGEHEVEYRSVDNAGNVEETKSVEFSIAGEDPGEDPEAPTVQGFADPATGAAPLRVQFSATGLDPEGGRVNYKWEFGDGSGSFNASARHTYTTPGTYTATVTATDPQGKTATDTVEIEVTEDGNEAPTVTATADPVSGVAPTQVRFSARATDPDGRANQITYLWDFDDNGANAFGRNARHTYLEPGSYTATVTATDADGAFDTAEVEVVVANPPGNVAPTVQAAATPRSGTAPVQVRFSSASSDPDGDRVSTVWSFGDGGQAGGTRATHTYTTPGTYTATVTVTDPDGETGTDTVQITVTGAGQASPPPTSGQQGSPPAQPQPGRPAPEQSDEGGVQGETESRPLVKAPRWQKVRRAVRRGLRLRP